MTDTQTIRYRQDGSIDTAYYVALGRARRSEAAHRMAKSSARAPWSFSALVALAAAWLPVLGDKS